MGFIFFIVYNIFSPFLIILSFFISFFLKTRSFTPSSFSKRILSKAVIDNKNVLFHCSSIGEINSVKTIIEYFKEKKYEIAITTFTEIALKKASEITKYSYLCPFDFYFITKRFIKNIKNIDFVFIAETEIWPNYIKLLSKKSKLYYINARISKHSFKYYKFFSPFIRYILKDLKKIFVQDEENYNRFIHFVDKDKIEIVGNTKYDILKNIKIENKYEEILKKLKWEDKKIIVFGSIHPDEFSTILKSYKILDKNKIRYIIVPRHIEKIEVFENIIKKFNIKYEKYSKIEEREDIFKDFYDTDIVIVDKTGILIDLYSISYIAFVGGTLNKIGGHNLLEPSVFSKPIIFGPNYFTQKQAGNRLIEYNGGFIVNDEYDIKSRINVLISNIDYYKKSSQGSNKALISLCGATEKIIREIENSR